MARRRSKRSKRGSVRIRRWITRGLLVIAGLLVISSVAGYMRLRAYLQSDGFRDFLGAKAGELLGADARFDSFRWDGLQVTSSSFEANGGRYASRLRADNLRGEVGLGGVRRGVWLLRGAVLRRIEVELPDKMASAGETRIQESGHSASTPPQVAAWIPQKVELEDLRIEESVVSGRLGGGKFVARGQSWLVKPDSVPGGFEIEGRGGSIDHPLHWFPKPRVSHARFRSSGRRLYLISSESKVYRNGLLDLSGEALLDEGEFTFEGGAVGIGCDEVLPEDWQKRLTGKVGARFTVRGRNGETTVKGKVSVRDGVLTALPVLDRLAAYADTTRFRILTLNDARTDFSWREGQLTLTDLLISSEGLMRLSGRLDVRGKQLDGQFRLGLAPGTLARIPGAETVVFAERSDGLMWTTLRVTGTLDEPKEDLSERLIAAAGGRMFEILPETGAQVLKFTRKAVGETSTKMLENRGEAVGAGVDMLRDAGSIVRGLFGLLPQDDKNGDD